MWVGVAHLKSEENCVPLEICEDVLNMYKCVFTYMQIHFLDNIIRI
jgi:hypothetical protein